LWAMCATARLCPRCHPRDGNLSPAERITHRQGLVTGVRTAMSQQAVEQEKCAALAAAPRSDRGPRRS
jgi:hypothetical protein